ncbi:helix-turn-helix domain-containing protein [Chryseobacterium sp. LC2016-29]|uniref:helix-turn-helix domain-containing protein n=1 Tax=Chryseobacterium sp. LC2016-29 TaxID=2897331 RepID=UPI001E5AAAC3|nr:helix-turn-helix domain-containing protein [Chryseobacterium sp. LC2016-29]MCD0477899.1 helix-turn-helix domain-containing protein [Chryseobacterium sp. LC2016-29]
MSKPDYQRIYRDLLKMKFPEKENDCQPILQKANFSQLDVINLEIILFGKKQSEEFLNNGRHRSYDKSTIFKILDYQKKK